MTDQELRDALDGLFAWDSHCSSGINDPDLLSKVKDELKKDLSSTQIYGDRIAVIAREMFLSDEAIQNGYGLEDIKNFIEWLDRI